MDKIEIEPTKSSPFVRFDPDDGVMEIGGESYPENSHEFFAPLMAWIAEFLDYKPGSAVLRVTLTYMNTSSTKYMIDILDRLEAAHGAGTPVRVEGYCDADNERTMGTVEELQEDFAMPFDVIPQEF